MVKQGKDIVFTLDIGTRTVIGLVIEYRDDLYRIIDSEVVEHEERAMLDGQIHNVNQVARQVKLVKERLEERLGIILERVAIAAAGRALRTVDYDNIVEFDGKKIITAEDVQALEFSAVQKAQTQLASSGNAGDLARDYHFVAYSVREYILDGMNIGSLEGQRGHKIEAKIIATFLPRIVVDSLLTVVSEADLEVDYLTLEPIAVSSVVIPKDMYNFNLALVDIGAGTSDIAITKGGSMIAYAMVPVAGDEITESLAEHYLLDYNTGEKLKRSLIQGGEMTVRNILSQEITIPAEEAVESIRPVVQSLASQIAESILMQNKKEPQAVMCVGGGSLTPGLLEEIASVLGLPAERVGVKDYSDIKNIAGSVDAVSKSQVNTPIGIAISSHKDKRKTSFLNIEVNGVNYQLLTLDRPTVADALLAAEIDFRKLRGIPGMGLTCTVNGELKTIKGSLGTPGKVLLNGSEVEDLERIISSRDKIVFEPGEEGHDARGVISDVLPELSSVQIFINGERVNLDALIYQNGLQVTEDAVLEDGAEIKYYQLETVRDVVASFYKKDPTLLRNEYISYKVNGRDYYYPAEGILVLSDGLPLDLDLPVEECKRLEIIESSNEDLTINKLLNGELKDSIRIEFNGSRLEIPTSNKIYCNKKIVDKEYCIKDGDEIKYSLSPLTINKVFDFISYKITPFNENYSLTINGKEAGLEEQVAEGDKIELSFGKRLGYKG
ncbi:cell division protein FtsA [Halocella sp. SP3-1]|uniref:cell division protein FtsA n=1 Tax=Halocella sp. SP3-1 TaxID=2382161 RepID=UPI000F75CFCD|nr:cell division protein FtsA [Halocella sp. SP3-1]AZO94294.1 cell division protein FtsA [Halocella sp. SP3-1]